VLTAVILDIVQQASFLIPSLGLESKDKRDGNAPELMITYIII